MRLIEKLTGSSEAKAFEEPPFWALDRFRAMLGSYASPDREQIENDFEGYVRGAYQASGAVFSTAISRMYLFSQARMQWQQYRNGRPGKLFGNPNLSILERPWANATTSDLLARMDQDSTNAGNYYSTLVDDQGRTGARAKRAGDPSLRVFRMRPDWVTIVKGSKSGHPLALDSKLVGYLFEPPMDGKYGKPEPVLLLPEDVCHYAPLPDPLATYRGMSWITPVIREVQADRAASRHKVKFFENGATITQMVRLDKEITPEDFDAFVARFKAQHEGVDMSYKTLFLGGGADMTPVTATMVESDMKGLQGAAETRIASAGGMHPVVVGMAEGLQGSSLNAGNFDAAVRITADKTLRFLWGNAAASLERLVPTPDDPSVRLGYDDRDIPFLRDDEKDVAEVEAKKAQTIRVYVDAGFTPESAVSAVESGDLTLLKHTGLFSVQLQAPGMGQGTDALTDADRARAAVEAVQKVYLGVGVVLTDREARDLVRRAGADNLTGALSAPPTRAQEA